MELQGHLDGMLLAILSEGPMHGYAVTQALRDRSAGVFDLPEGTIYPALHRLERAGSLVSRWETVSGRRRRVYALAPSGRSALMVTLERWESFRSAVDAVMRTPGTAGAP
jgi:PadR family transcriptional regulator, regulatory protein PadR